MSPPGKCMEMPVEMSELKSCMSKSGVTNYTCDEVTRNGPKGRWFVPTPVWSYGNRSQQKQKQYININIYHVCIYIYICVCVLYIYIHSQGQDGCASRGSAFWLRRVNVLCILGCRPTCNLADEICFQNIKPWPTKLILTWNPKYGLKVKSKYNRGKNPKWNPNLKQTLKKP